MGLVDVTGKIGTTTNGYHTQRNLFKDENKKLATSLFLNTIHREIAGKYGYMLAIVLRVLLSRNKIN